MTDPRPSDVADDALSRIPAGATVADGRAVLDVFARLYGVPELDPAALEWAEQQAAAADTPAA